MMASARVRPASHRKCQFSFQVSQMVCHNIVSDDRTNDSPLSFSCHLHGTQWCPSCSKVNGLYFRETPPPQNNQTFYALSFFNFGYGNVKINTNSHTFAHRRQSIAVTMQKIKGKLFKTCGINEAFHRSKPLLIYNLRQSKKSTMEI